MNRVLTACLLTAWVVINGCAVKTVLVQKQFNRTAIKSIGIVEPVVIIEEIAGNSIRKKTDAMMSARSQLKNELTEKLGQYYEIEEPKKIPAAMSKRLYKVFSKVDYVLERGGLYDKESIVNKAHLDTHLADVGIDKKVLSYIDKFNSDYVLLTLREGILQDQDRFQSRQVSVAELVGDGINDKKSDIEIIPYYAYLAVALVDKQSGRILYYDKSYRHLDPRDRDVLTNQLTGVLEGLKRK